MYILVSGTANEFLYNHLEEKLRFSIDSFFLIGDINGIREYISGREKIPKFSVFVRGCYDFEDLDTLRNKTIDPFQNLFYLYGGPKILISNKKEKMRIAGLGGFKIDKRELKLLSVLEKDMIDVLLTHSVNPLIYNLINKLEPKYHFYYHGRTPMVKDKTISVSLNPKEMWNGKKLLQLEGSSLGILDINSWNFYYISETYSLIDLDNYIINDNVPVIYEKEIK